MHNYNPAKNTQLTTEIQSSQHDEDAVSLLKRRKHFLPKKSKRIIDSDNDVDSVAKEKVSEPKDNASTASLADNICCRKLQ
jgi:hypothetical protein